MMSQYEFLMTQEDWFNRGKEDAWLGRSKQAPEHDSQAASLYDLGYSEGKTQRSPIPIPDHLPYE